MATMPERLPLATLERPSDPLLDSLAAVEELLLRYSASEIGALQEAARHILGAGGKRIRPQLLIRAAQAAGGRAEHAVSLAAAVELIHTATLVHDDIVDEADSRRGRTTVQLFFGNAASVLMGDYLVVRAFGIVAERGDERVWRILADTIARMCEGEVLQLCIKGDTGVSLAVYETIIEAKTAALLGACGQFGGFVGGAPPEVTAALAEYGYTVGMAFQIADDILDFVGDEQLLGKPVGGDLRERKVTLPVIYALESAPPEDREVLQGLYEKTNSLLVEDVERACRILRSACGFERARSHAWMFVRRAHAALERVPASAAREALRQLATQVVDRRA